MLTVLAVGSAFEYAFIPGNPVTGHTGEAAKYQAKDKRNDNAKCESCHKIQ